MSNCCCGLLSLFCDAIKENTQASRIQWKLKVNISWQNYLPQSLWTHNDNGKFVNYCRDHSSLRRQLYSIQVKSVHPMSKGPTYLKQVIWRLWCMIKYCGVTACLFLILWCSCFQNFEGFLRNCEWLERTYNISMA